MLDSSGPVPTQTTRAQQVLSPPGLVGSGTVWHRCVQQVDSRYRAGDWMALEGEPGTGKRSLLRAIHRLHNPSGHFRVMLPPIAEYFDTPTALRSVCPRTVDVPPLRHHIDDLAQLVPHLLEQIPNGGRLTCSPAALAQLSRLNWPGNVAQLRGVLL
ncbi:MAG: hypothetical protein ACR2N4_12105 [Jatrophihabitans sp.]